MSVRSTAHRPDLAQASMLCSLAELSYTLDRTAESPTAPPWAELTAPRRPVGYRWVDPMHVGLLCFGGLGVLFCGVLAFFVSTPRMAFSSGPMPATTQAVEECIPQLDDPVLQGRGGRAPQVLNPAADAVPGADCAGTQVAFVNGLSEAARLARERNKLLLILNVSGDFDDARFT